MDLSSFLDPCPYTAVEVVLPPKIRAQLREIQKGEIVLFAANQSAGDDNPLVVRFLEWTADNLIASAAAHLGAHYPGPGPADCVPWHGVRTLRTTLSGEVYVGEAALNHLQNQIGTRPYAERLRQRFPIR